MLRQETVDCAKAQMSAPKYCFLSTAQHLQGEMYDDRFQSYDPIYLCNESS